MKRLTRRSFIRVVGVSAIVLPTLGAGRCGGKAEILRQAGLLFSTIRNASSILRSVAPGISAKLDLILPIAEKLRTAVEANDQTNAVLYLRAMIPAFIDIIDHDVPRLAEGLRQRVLIALAIADIALNFLADFYTQNAPAGVRVAPGAGSDAIVEFSRRPVWGHKYAK